VAFIFIGMQFGDRPVQTTDIPAPTTETTIAAEEPRTAAPPLEIDPAPVPSPVPAPVPNTAPAPTVIPVPVVAPVPVTSAPIPAASHPVSFASVPLGAELIVDGVSMGTTPQRLQLTGGSHRIEMVLREHNTMQTIAIGVHSANAFSWRVDEDRWVNSRN